jgi:hypothetical protein
MVIKVSCFYGLSAGTPQRYKIFHEIEKTLVDCAAFRTKKTACGRIFSPHALRPAVWRAKRTLGKKKLTAAAGRSTFAAGTFPKVVN